MRNLGWFERSSLRRFPRLVFPDDRDAAERVRVAALAAVDAATLPDRASVAIITSSAVVVEADRELVANGLEPDTARARLVEPFRRSAGGAWVGRGTRWMLRTVGARRFVRAMGGARTRRTYGSLFVFEEEVPGAYRQWVRRCGFYDYLARHDVPELSAVFCAWDLLWADEVNRLDRGVRFERPATIADGSDACLFEFRFTGD